MRSVPKKLPGYLAVGIIISIAAPIFAQQSSEVFVPPIVVPTLQNQSATDMPQILPPIVAPERAKSTSNSGMLQPISLQGNSLQGNSLQPISLQPISPQPEMMVDQQVQPLDTLYETAGKTISAAGVPIYPEGSAIFSQGGFDASSGLENAAFIQGSGTRNAPPIVGGNGLPPGSARSLSPGTIQPQYPMPQLETPSSVVPPAAGNPPVYYNQPGASVPQGSPIVSQGSTFQSPVSQAPGANNYFAQPTNGQYNPNAQSQYGAPNVDTGCTSCGPGGCYDPAAVESQFGCSGSVSNASYYLMAEAMALNRYDGDIQASNFFELSDFGWGAGGRFTLGYRQNATTGRELTFYGTFQDIEETKEQSNPDSLLNAVFIPGGGFAVRDDINGDDRIDEFDFQASPEVGSFYQADRQVQTKSTEIFSLEYNRVKWGYDVIKTQIGVRYIYMDDSFTFFSQNPLVGSNGTFNMHSINNLIGANWGGEIFYDVGYRASVSVLNKWGGYLNLADFDTLLANNGLVSIDKNIKDSHLASTIELGFMGHYQLNPRVRFRIGYEVMWMWGIFTVNNNFPRLSSDPFLIPRPEFVTPETGSDLNTNAQPVSWNGFSFGMEFFR